ncbi:MAG: alpha/beta fold hydrolase [Candidatus Goldiibacteriota bacterium]
MKKEIVLISGWGAGRNAFFRIEEKLGEKFDFSYLPWEKGLNESFAAEFIRGRQKQVILMGWSLGGLIAIRAAAEIPEIISGLALISATPRMTRDEGYDGAREGEIRAMAAGLLKNRERIIEGFAKKAFGGGAEIDEYKMSAAGFTTDELLSGLQLLEKTDIRKNLDLITVPALIMHGKQDSIIPVSQARLIHDMIKASSLLEFDAGHGLPYIAPDILIEATGGFQWK